MEKKCALCGKMLTDEDEYRFFPEDDTYLCMKCLLQTAKGEKE